MKVRELLRDREADESGGGSTASTWTGRCLDDRFEIGALIAETDHVALHYATADGSDDPLLATIYRGLTVSDETLTTLHSDLGALREAGFVPVSGMVQDDEGFVVFEAQPDGVPLSEYLSQEGALAPPVALSISGQLLATLSSVHDIGQTILSLSPQTIWISETNGFTTARPTRLGQRSLLGMENAKSRAEGICFAFASYLMPEAVSGRELTAASDIYSVGLVLYETLAGRPAFAGDDFKKVARKHALERPLNPRIVNRGAKLSSELDRAVMKALEKTVKRRHADSMVFFELLKATKEGEVTWSATPVVKDNGGEAVLETQAMSSLDGSELESPRASESAETVEPAPEENIGFASTQDSFPEVGDAAGGTAELAATGSGVEPTPENADRDEDEPLPSVEQTPEKRSQTQPLSSSLTRAVLDGLEKKASDDESAKAAADTKPEPESESPSENILADEVEGNQTPPDPTESNQAEESLSDADDAFEGDDEDWYADSPEQYASKTAHYDPYELEGESRDSNLLPKILVGVGFLAVVMFLVVSSGSDESSDSEKTPSSTASNSAEVDKRTELSKVNQTNSTGASKPKITRDAASQKAAAEKAAAEKVAAEKAAEEKAAAEKAAEEKAAAEKAAEEKAAAEKAAAEKAAAEKAAAEKAAAEEKAAKEKAAAAKAKREARAKAKAKAKEAARKRQEKSIKQKTASIAATIPKSSVGADAKNAADAATAKRAEQERQKRAEDKRKQEERQAKRARGAEALKEGSRLIRQGNHAAAKGKFREAIASGGLSGSGLARAYAGLGSAEFAQGNFSGSVKQYRRSVNSNGGNAQRWYKLAVSYYRLNNTQAAKKAAQRALNLAPNHSGAKKLLKRTSQ